MIQAVPAALLCTAAARFRAEYADGLHVLTAPGHRRSGKPANIGAFQIQSDTARHGFWVGLLEARRGALQARSNAFAKCAQACILDLVGHGNSSKLLHGLCRSSVAARGISDCSSSHTLIRQIPIRTSRLNQFGAWPASVTRDSQLDGVADFSGPDPHPVARSRHWPSVIGVVAMQRAYLGGIHRSRDAGIARFGEQPGQQLHIGGLIVDDQDDGSKNVWVEFLQFTAS